MRRPIVKCPYCKAQAQLHPASFLNIKGSPDDLYYVCARYPACNSYVKAHTFNRLPMGTLANPRLRRKRQEAHQAMEQLWLNGLMSRKEAYRWLQIQMGLPAEEAHIAKFSEQRCEQVIQLCRQFPQLQNAA